MIPSALAYLVLYLLAALITLAVAIYTWRHQTVDGALQYSMVAWNQLLWIIFFLFELTSPTLDAKVFWDNLQWINAALLPVSLLWFAIAYSGLKPPKPRLFWGVILGITGLFIVLVLSNRFHHLIVTENVAIEQLEPFPELVYSFTPVTYLFIVYLLAIAGVALGILLWRISRLTYPSNRHALALVAAIAIPYVASIAVSAGMRFGPQRDVAPITFGISSLIALVGLYRLKLFDITPIARDVLVENLHDEVIVVDAQSHLVYLNRAARARLGKNAGEWIGRRVADVYQAWPELRERLLDPEQATAFTVQQDGGKVSAYQVRASRLLDQIGRPGGWVILLNDVTALKVAEDELLEHRNHLAKLVDQRTQELTQALRELRRSKELLEQRVAERTGELAAQNRELETFAYSVSHDLKAPLRGIDGYSQLLLEHTAEKLDPEERLFLGNIRKATAQMHQLIEDLLAYSRFQRRSYATENVDLGWLVDLALKEFDEPIRNRQISVKLEIECRQVMAEAEGLTQAFRNLIDNAIKFTRTQPEAEICIGSKTTPDGCLMWVKDNGIGFNMAYHDRIFDLFQRLHRMEEYEGTGIGLALVRKALLRMNGEIWAESVPGQGATFWMRIPEREQAEI